MANRYRAWTETEDARLKELKGWGWTNAEISKELILSGFNRSMKAVEHRIHKLGISPKAHRVWTDSEIGLLVELFLGNELSYRKIAARLGRSDTAVRRKLAKLGYGLA